MILPALHSTVTPRNLRLRNAPVSLIATCAVLLLTTTRPVWAATATDSKFQPNLEATVHYLQQAQRENGGFAEPGREPNADFTAWTTLALAAAGINPRDQTTVKQHYAAGHSAYAYLVEHAHEASLTTDFERELLVVDATGASPHDFGGVNLPGEILARQITHGSQAGGFPHEAGSSEPAINDTIFAILALSPINEPTAQAAISRAAAWLEREQNCDGSWNTLHPRALTPCIQGRHLLAREEEGEIDMTSAAIQALSAANRTNVEGQENAFEFLHEAQAANGGLWEFPGENEPNVASTAWAVQAMWSAGINPENWTTDAALASDEPLGYLASMQQPDGHIRFKASKEENGMWMTAYVTPALTGNPLPILAVPYEELPLSPPERSTGASPSDTSTGSGSGDGGTAGTQGTGVIAGGGGTPAPLFSRPQPHSQGHTPGGARQLKHLKNTANHPRKRNPGRSRKRTAPTITTPTTATSKNIHPTSANAAQTGRAHKTSAANRRPRASTNATNTTTAGGGAGDRGALLPGASTSQANHTAGARVSGVPIGEPRPTGVNDRPEAGAPGLRSAGAGGDEAGWPTTATSAAIALLILTGMLVERRRPHTTL